MPPSYLNQPSNQAGLAPLVHLSLALLVALAAWVTLTPAWPALAQDPSDTPRQNLWVTNGSVNAVVENGNILYIGGDFTYVGPTTGSGVPINATSGAALPAFPQVNGTVYAAVPDNRGGWYIGGYFSQVGGEARISLAHILADYRVDPIWNPNVSGQVYTLAVSGTTVYVGGALPPSASGAATTWLP